MAVGLLIIILLKVMTTNGARIDYQEVILNSGSVDIAAVGLQSEELDLFMDGPTRCDTRSLGREVFSPGTSL